MADKTGISWSDATWNVVTGCSKTTPGCKFCYAERDWARVAHLPKYAGRKFTDVACHPELLDQPLRWQRQRKIFVNAMSDLFHEDVPVEFIDQVFAVMGLSFVMRDDPHIFQILTKRAERMHDYLNDPETVIRVTRAMKAFGHDLPGENSPPAWPLPNVWLGVSTETQETANIRINLLMKTPAAVRWISAEPQLGLLDVSPWLMTEQDRRAHLDPRYRNASRRELIALQQMGVIAEGIKPAIDWVVNGGESGAINKSRPMNPAWARSLQAQSAEFGTPYFYKQEGSWSLMENGYVSAHDAEKSKARAFPSAGGVFVHTHGGGRELLDGKEYHAWPAMLAERI